MGKGALISNIINKVSDSSYNIPVLYHFCNSGIANNLHAILYHLILQGRKSQIWNLDDDEIYQKVKSHKPGEGEDECPKKMTT